MKNEIRIGVRSGASSTPRGTSPIKVIIVSGEGRPMMWLGGAGAYDGRAWVSGRATLLRLRDALTKALETGGTEP